MVDGPALYDTHAHIVSDDHERYPPAESKRHFAAAPFTVEQLLAGMDELGVGTACVVQRYHWYLNDNSYVLDSCAAHPDRLVPVVILDAEAPEAPDELRKLSADGPMGGIRFGGPAWDRMDTEWLNGRGAMRLWEAAAELGLPVTVICFEPHLSWNLPALARVAELFPELPILVDHLGTLQGFGPDGDAHRGDPARGPYMTPPDYGITRELRALAARPNVSFKFTGINLDCLAADGLDPAEHLRLVADKLGVDRLVIGSDIGQTRGPYSRIVDGLREATRLLDDAERAAVLHDNAARIYSR